MKPHLHFFCTKSPHVTKTMNLLSFLVVVCIMPTVSGQNIDDYLIRQPELHIAENVRSETQKCGIRPRYSSHFDSPDFDENKIVNGEYASYGEIPWQASLDVLSQYRVDNVFSSQYCGASIINEFWLVTAAHCVEKHTSTYLVTVGNHHWSNQDEYEQTFVVETIIKHELFTGAVNLGDYDIALVKIKQPVYGRGIQFNDYVQPVCLPDSRTSLKEGTKCLVSGWGRTHSDHFSEVLKKAELQIVNQRTCQQMHPATPITDRMVCAGGLQRDTTACGGDSGGGLTYKSRGAYTLIGVVSWGADFCPIFKPGVFANVLILLPWIKSNLQRHSDSYQQSMLPSRPLA